jgi:hypothetical protein
MLCPHFGLLDTSRYGVIALLNVDIDGRVLNAAGMKRIQQLSSDQLFHSITVNPSLENMESVWTRLAAWYHAGGGTELPDQIKTERQS